MKEDVYVYWEGILRKHKKSEPLGCEWKMDLLKGLKDQIKYRPAQWIREDLERCFRLSCENNHMEGVMFLLFELIRDFPSLKINPRSMDDAAMRWACESGHLDIVQFLLTDERLIKEGYEHACVQSYEQDAFMSACSEGHLEVVQYLLTDSVLGERGQWAELGYNECLALRKAAWGGHLNVVKYLLTDPQIKTKHPPLDVHAQKDCMFRWACLNEHRHVIEWLILDYGLKKTKAIENYDHVMMPWVLDLFRARDEYKILNNGLGACPSGMPKPIKKL